jgi:site-specific recombinase XerD
MIEDMTVRNLSPATQRSYVHAVAKFSQYFGKSPDQLGLEDVRAYQVHLESKGLAWASFNQVVCALRFFYGGTLARAEMPERIATCSASKTQTGICSAYRGPGSRGLHKRTSVIKPMLPAADLGAWPHQ